MSAARPQGRSGPKLLRCAVYTRKSTEQGLEQAFNSLNNQREAAEAYIKSQAHEGWSLLPAPYDDGGISGGTLDRPALQRLLEEVRAGRVDIIVVYKVDRLTRSLTDFAKLVELFDQHGASFVSVTQAFNTTTSMGRLTLNVLLSFAQFEREVTGERIRDKVAASKRKGLWLGGVCPFGYQVENKCLVPHPVEAEQVRFMFGRYLEVGSIKALIRDLDSRGMRTRVQPRTNGTQRGGLGFNPTGLCHLLKNRCYIGEVVHKGRYHPGVHEPIVDRVLFEAVGAALTAKAPQQHHKRANRESLLKGLLYDAKGDRMTPASCGPRGPIYRYYISRVATVGRRAEAPKRYRISAPGIEAKVLEVLGWEPARPVDAPGDALPSPAALLRERMLAHVERVTVFPDTIRIEMKGSEDDEAPAPVTVPWVSRGRYAKPIIADPETGRRLSVPIGQQQRARLLQGIANGRRWLDELAEGEVADVESLAKRENCSARYIRIVLNLAFLPPDTVRAAIAGTLSAGMGVVSLSERPVLWEQHPSRSPT